MNALRPFRAARTFALAGSLLLPVGCGDDDTTTDTMTSDGSVSMDMASPESVAYAFDSRFEPGTSSVDYGGQVFRHLLIEDLQAFIGDLSGLIDRGGDFVEPAAVESALRFYYEFDESGLSESIRFTTTPPLSASVYGDLGGARNLAGKLAGQDGRDHEDWNGGAFAGWNDEAFGGTESPAALVEAMFAALGQQASLRSQERQPTGPDGEVLPVHVTGDGLDLRELIQKFLLVAVAFSQGSDDYLDEGLEGPNTQREGEAYSALERAWDEAFGYFGAARDYDRYSDDEIAGAGGRADWQGVHDSDGDGAIDPTSEVNFGHAVNAAERDRGAASDLDLSADAFEAFVAGRRLLSEAGDELTAAERTELEGYRDQAVGAWERSIAATVIHYINGVMDDMDAKEAGEGYRYADHARRFSALKGSSLGLQFNPRSPLSSADFVAFHESVGDRPALDVADFTDYRASLIEARAILATAYGFAPADVEAF